MAIPSQEQVMGQLRILIPALGTIATAFGMTQAEAGSYTQIALTLIGPIAYLICLVWSLVRIPHSSL